MIELTSSIIIATVLICSGHLMLKNAAQSIISGMYFSKKGRSGRKLAQM